MKRDIKKSRLFHTVYRGKYTQYALWAFSGVLTGVALIIPVLWVLAFVGLLVQLHMLLHRQTHSLRSMFAGAGLAGTIHMLTVLLWYWSTVPFDWIGITSMAVHHTMIFAAWVATAVTIGGGYGLTFAVLWYLTQRHWSLLIMFPFALLIAELMGRLFYSLLVVSLDSGLGVSFGIGHIGYILIEHQSLRIFAIFAGVYGLTVLAGMVTVLFYVVLKKCVLTSKWQMMMCIGVFFIFYVSSFIVTPFRSQIPLPEKVVLVQTAFPTTFDQVVGRAVIDDIHRQIVTQSLEQGYETIILPEDARFMDSVTDQQREQLIELSTNPFVIVDSGLRKRGKKRVLSAIVYDSQKDRSYTYDKQNLVPFGEQMPFSVTLFMKLLNKNFVVQYMQNNFGYRVGLSKNRSDTPDYLPSVLFCYESMVPYAVRRIDTTETPFVAHVVSHAWFQDRQFYLKNQLSAMLRTQALWNNTYILQSSNMAPTAVYTPAGDVFYGAQIENDSLYLIETATQVVSQQRRRL